jgi:hypothetical protein
MVYPKRMCRRVEPLNLVLVGDYQSLLKLWTTEFDVHNPLYVSTVPISSKVPRVCVFALGVVTGAKYWEQPGSKAHATKVESGDWLPQMVANELQNRIVEEGEDSVPRGEFIEEACNVDGESILVVDAQLLREQHSKFLSMFKVKGFVAKFVMRRFFSNHVTPHTTRAVAAKFCANGTSLDEAESLT